MNSMRVLKSRRVFLLQALACVPVVALAATAEDKTKPAPEGPESYQVRLIWASNDESSPNPEHKKLDSELTAFLKKSFKWSSYYEVSKKELSIPLNKEEWVVLSNDCKVKIKNLGGSQLEADLYGKGKRVSNTKAKLEKWVILAGPAENETGWFVVIRKTPKSK